MWKILDEDAIEDLGEHCDEPKGKLDHKVVQVAGTFTLTRGLLHVCKAF